MTVSIRRELLIPQPREQVWRAITESAAVAEWMYPNDFEPCVDQALRGAEFGWAKMLKQLSAAVAGLAAVSK